MIAALEEIYADAIGTEFQHIQNPRIRNWVRDRIESRPAKHQASTQVEIALLRLLLESEAFEVFLHTRYVGQKRFSLQGAESLMVILDTILHRCPGGGIEEICMGMAHRGRLNVLANFLQKSLGVIFTEFNTNYIPELVAGDIRLDTRSGKVSRAGEPIKLTAQEYKLLSYLMHHKGKVVSRTELIEHIYDQDFDRDSNTIEVFVTRIRKKLGADTITTIRGLGYSLEDPGA